VVGRPGRVPGRVGQVRGEGAGRGVGVTAEGLQGGCCQQREGRQEEG